MKQIQDEESEFRRVTKEYLERLNEFVSKTQRDEGETARITFDVPVEWLSLFAWLEARHAQRARDEWDMGEFPVPLKPNSGHKHQAENLMWRHLDHLFHDQLHKLSLENHGLLTARTDEEKQAEAEQQARIQKDIEDGIPF